MTWGKGGSSNVVQVTTRSRRAFSVPAADVEYEPSSVGSKTARTVYSAMDDANNLSLASKRHDRKLLSDIQMRMHKLEFDSVKPGRDVAMKTGFRRFLYGHKPALEKETTIERRKDELRYPWPSRDNFYRAPRKDNKRRPADDDADGDHYPRHDPLGLYRPREKKPEVVISEECPMPLGRWRAVGEPLPFGGVRGGARSLVDLAYDDDDVAAYDVLPPPRSRPIDIYVPAYDGEYQLTAGERLDPDTSRRIRESRDEIDAFDRLLDEAFPRRRRGRHLAATRHTAGRLLDYSRYLDAGTDDVAQVDYQPAPITSRFRASSEPRPFLPSTNLAVKQAKASLNRIERELGMGTVTLDDAPDFDEPIVRTSQIVPVTAVRTGWYRGSSPPLRRRSYNTITSRPPPAPRSTRLHEIEARLETMLVPETIVQPVSLSSLRSRTAEARNKLDRHKVLLDRYLPLPVGPLNEVPYEVEYKFSELVDRMPHLRPRDVIQRASSLPPVSPISAPVNRAKVNQYNDAFRAPPIRPAMSDTRKRAREVLCRTKGDPHYFDY